jgi:SAM-dependent methyltransferase
MNNAQQLRDPQTLRDGVHRVYSGVADSPQDEHPIPVGREFAARLGYAESWLDRFPLAAESFAGVSHVHGFAEIPDGATVLDLGCGAGLDSLIAAHRVGPTGKVFGVDFSESMLNRARHAVTEYAIRNTEFKRGDAEGIPLPDASVDVALVNGLFNLNPAREQIFRELARVVRPGGVVYSAEIILPEPLPPEEAANITNWFA